MACVSAGVLDRDSLQCTVGEYRADDTLQLNLAEELNYLNPGPCIQSMQVSPCLFLISCVWSSRAVRLPQLDQQGAQRPLIRATFSNSTSAISVKLFDFPGSELHVSHFLKTPYLSWASGSTLFYQLSLSELHSSPIRHKERRRRKLSSGHIVLE